MPQHAPLAFPKDHISWDLMNFFFFAPISLFLSALLCLSAGNYCSCLFSSFSILLLLSRIGFLRLSLLTLHFNHSCPCSLNTCLLLLSSPQLFSSFSLLEILSYLAHVLVNLKPTYSFLHLTDDDSSLFLFNFRIPLPHFFWILSHPEFIFPILLHCRETLYQLSLTFSTSM